MGLNKAAYCTGKNNRRITDYFVPPADFVYGEPGREHLLEPGDAYAGGTGEGAGADAVVAVDLR